MSDNLYRLETEIRITEELEKQLKCLSKIRMNKMRMLKDKEYYRPINIIRRNIKSFFFRNFSLKICTSISSKIKYKFRKLFK